MLFLFDDRDFSLADEGPGLDLKSIEEMYTALKNPTSMRACLVQVAQDTYHALLEAHKAMYEVKLRTSSVKGMLQQGVKILMMVSIYWN